MTDLVDAPNPVVPPKALPVVPVLVLPNRPVPTVVLGLAPKSPPLDAPPNVEFVLEPKVVPAVLPNADLFPKSPPEVALLVVLVVFCPKPPNEEFPNVFVLPPNIRAYNER